MSVAATPFDLVVDRLEEMGCRPSSHGTYVKAFCPAHDDRKQKSLSVRDMNGDAAPKCFVGCSFREIVAALRLETKDFYIQRSPFNGNNGSRIVATYDYRSKDEKLVFQVVRFEPKNFRVRRPGPQGKGWTWSLKGVKQVPYNLPEVLNAIGADELVFVAEGEKDCDQLATLGLTATTNASGALKWKREFASIFQGARVVILCDNDDKGRQHASDVARKLTGAVAEVRILDLSQHTELPEKSDVSTWIELHRAQKRKRDEIRAELLHLVEVTSLWKSTPRRPEAPAPTQKQEDAEIEEPIPLERALPPAPPFPVDILPPVLSRAVRGIQEMTQAPISICAQSVLATASLAAQSLADVELPVGAGTVRPVSCYFVTIGVSGERKSSADSLALEPIKRREAVLRDRSSDEMRQYRDRHDTWSAERQRILKGHKAFPTHDAKQEALEELGSEPEAPLTAVLTCPEPTLEGAYDLLEHGQPSLGLFSDEGGMFIGGYSMHIDRRLKTGAGLSGFWDGSVVTDVRKGRIRTLVGKRLSLHLMLQPQIAETLMTDEILENQGLLSRILVCYPESTIGTRLWREVSDEARRGLAEYNLRMSELLAHDGERRELRLDPSARQLWRQYADHIEPHLRGDLQPVQGLANKIPEHATRLAAILATVETADVEVLTAEHLQRGIDLAQFYLDERLRLVGTGGDSNVRKAQELLEWIQSEWTEPALSLRVVLRRGPSSLRTKAVAEPLVELLETHGWLIPAHDAVVDGKKARQAWWIWRKVDPSKGVATTPQAHGSPS